MRRSPLQQPGIGSTRIELCFDLTSSCPPTSLVKHVLEDETKREAYRRRDSWDQEEYTEAEVQAGWAALEQMESEDDSGLRAMKSAIGAQELDSAS